MGCPHDARPGRRRAPGLGASGSNWAWPYFIGWAIALLLLIYENRQVKADDLSRVNVIFFRVNGYISVQLLAFTILALVVS